MELVAFLKVVGDKTGGSYPNYLKKEFDDLKSNNHEFFTELISIFRCLALARVNGYFYIKGLIFEEDFGVKLLEVIADVEVDYFPYVIICISCLLNKKIYLIKLNIS